MKFTFGLMEFSVDSEKRLRLDHAGTEKYRSADPKSRRPAVQLCLDSGSGYWQKRWKPMQNHSAMFHTRKRLRMAAAHCKSYLRTTGCASRSVTGFLTESPLCGHPHRLKISEAKQYGCHMSADFTTTASPPWLPMR